MSIDAAQLKATGVYASQSPIAALLRDLGDIEQLCQKWKAYRTRVRWLCFGLLVGGFLALVLLNEIPGMVVLGPVAMLVAIAGFVYAYRYARNSVLQVERCGTVRTIVETFRNDTHPQSPVSVKVSLGNERTMLSQSDWAARKKGKQRFYRSGWLTIENQFLDGSKLSGTVTDLIRERTFVNPRGKRKKKIRTHHLVAMRLRYEAEVYGDASRAPQQLQAAVKTPSTARLKGIEVTDGDIKLKATVNITSDLPKTCTMLLLGAYRILNLSRKVSAGQRATQGGAQ